MKREIFRIAFSEQPNVQVFSNLYKFKQAHINRGMTIAAWSKLYDIPKEDLRFALEAIKVSGSLYTYYQHWLSVESDLDNYDNSF